jgi:ribosomal protein S18 acetylase RimI-like enzyme
MALLNQRMEVRMVPKEDLWMVRELALQIFPVTYQDIVEAPQIDYMMDMFYSNENLVKQYDEGQVFLIIYLEEKPSGFAAFTRLDRAGEFKLNKIYLDTRIQGIGLGRCLLNDVVSRVRAAGGATLQLNVNKNNKAVGFYNAMGFTIKEEVLLDIGNGYFMDDFVMSLKLKA